ncbi:MAG: carboxypeptidase regulatory-like domain-containing protein [Phycisphaerales bacterium]|nr:carboxypeptidase regulatory-like domain-containing protein [Phycisphaerales bacterium]
MLDAKTDQPIAGASVRLDGDGDTIRATKVDEAGRFALAPAQLPTFAALTASADGYIPAAVNVAAAEIGDGVRVEFRLQPADNLDIALDAEPRVHHLGDDRFTGRINSQFQVSSQGRTYQAVIELERSQLTPPVVVAELSLFVRGAQNPNRIIINGVVITEPLADSPRTAASASSSPDSPSDSSARARTSSRSSP